MDNVRAVAARAMEDPSNIAMADSTTMGLGLIYGGLRLSPEDEIIVAEDNYSHLEAARLCSMRTGATVRRIKLYERPTDATEVAILDTVLSSITKHTRVIGLSWVHSNSGIKTFSELGCDFFITGCHKWLYGPRGTGLMQQLRMRGSKCCRRSRALPRRWIA